MSRWQSIFVIVIGLCGCRTAERAPLPALPDDASNVLYSELLSQTRQWAWKANEAYYRDDWKDLIDTTGELEKAAKLLPQTKSIPAHLTSTLSAKSQTLAADAGKLRDAATARQEMAANEIIQRIHMTIRELRFETKEAAAK